MNDPNNGAGSKAARAEGPEGRRAAKSNAEALPAPRTQSRTRASMWLDGVREAAQAAKASGKEVRFTALLHHVTPQLRRDSFMQLKRDAAAGVDGVRWRQNWLFAGSLRAGKRAAAVMSLIHSAKLNQIDPYAYIRNVLDRLPTQPASRIGELLPHRWQPTAST